MMLSFASRYSTIYITDLWVRWALPPGLCITLIILALALTSFGLETWANPRLRTSKGVATSPRHARTAGVVQGSASRLLPRREVTRRNPAGLSESDV